jgi:uncharacterized protein (DUF3084 family)
MSEQEMNLSSILAIVTNPDMVAKNIQKLQADMEKARIALKEVMDKKAEADAQFAKSQEIEENAKKRHAELDAREIEIKKREDHWMDKDTAQKKAEKEFNEIQLQHAARVREASIKEDQNEKRAKSLDDREAKIAEREANTKKANDEALTLKKTYEDKVASLKGFAAQI